LALHISWRDKMDKQITTKEFLQWFDGFVEAVDNKPTKEQWLIIRKKQATVAGSDMFVDNQGITKRHTNVQPLKANYE